MDKAAKITEVVDEEEMPNLSLNGPIPNANDEVKLRNWSYRETYHERNITRKHTAVSSNTEKPGGEDPNPPQLHVLDRPGAYRTAPVGMDLYRYETATIGYSE